MALELHPDKGGDPEKFQELQEMKDRWTRRFLSRSSIGFLGLPGDDVVVVDWCGLSFGFSDSPLAILNSCGPTYVGLLTHTTLVFFHRETQERLTDIEKEEGEGDGKKENEEDPEEEDHSYVTSFPPFFFGGENLLGTYFSSEALTL